MTTLNVPDRLYQRMMSRAARLNMPLEVFVTLAIERYLWQLEFDELLVRTQARTRSAPSEQIEADITAAFEEVRQMNRDNHRPA